MRLDSAPCDYGALTNTDIQLTSPEVSEGDRVGGVWETLSPNLPMTPLLIYSLD